MPRKQQHQMDLGLDPLPSAKAGLILSASALKKLTPAQVEFNKRMKALERARKELDNERTRLERELHICRIELMPLVEEYHRMERDLILAAAQALQSLKFTARRREWLDDLVSGKAANLLADPSGLDDKDIEQLEAVVDQLGPSVLEEEQKEILQEEFEELRDMMEEMARMNGVKLDLSDLDIHGDPSVFHRQLRERLEAAREVFNQPDPSGNPGPAGKKRPRKPTKAALERERRQREIEEAKTRDIKTLYKQLVKVLHPDLQTDPALKLHREEWMKRLTTAYANSDLRDMLEIEMEWLGEEGGNLAKVGDETLRIYAMVLQEQTAEIRHQLSMLAFDPQYHLLKRFTGPFGNKISVQRIKDNLVDDSTELKEMHARLAAGGPKARALLNQLANEHARMCSGR